MRPLKFLIVLLIVLQLADCGSSVTIFENAGQWLPSDFDPKKEVLTIIVGPAPDRQIDAMKGFMYKDYPYKYTFKRPELDENGRDADGVRYRFELRCFQNMEIKREDEKKMVPPYGSLDFYFYDRVRDKKYRQTDRPSVKGTPTFVGIIHTILDKASRQ